MFDVKRRKKSKKQEQTHHLMLQIYCVEHRITDMGQAETKIFENAPAWHESDVLATTDFDEEV